MGIGTCKRWNDGTGCEGTLVRSLDCLKKEEGRQGDLLPPKEGGGGDNANNVNAAAKPGFCTPKGGGNALASSYLSVPDCGCCVDAGKCVNNRTPWSYRPEPKRTERPKHVLY